VRQTSAHSQRFFQRPRNDISAGTEALSRSGDADRAELLRDPAFRRRFRRDWVSWLLGRAYHRDLDETKIIACPDPALVGMSLAQVAKQRGAEPVDTLLELVAEHGNQLRWYTVMGNDRPEWLRWIVKHPATLIGFSDAGAHLRNMAYYNFGIRLLRLVHDAEREGQPVMTIGRAFARLSSEISDFLGLDAGRWSRARAPIWW
jgi:N-acyl-D-aspartate/D-glutamate deacylase